MFRIGHWVMKLSIQGEGLLLEIYKSIAAYTAALTGKGNTPSYQGVEVATNKAFRLIQTQLIRQREWIGEGGT